MRLPILATLAIAIATPAFAQGGFTVERQISLGAVSGRIDHLAVDLADGILFVAELGNGSVSAINIATGAVIARATGLAEPQGLAFLAATKTLYVATGGDGLLHTFAAADLAPGPTVAIGPDADNVHLDASGSRLAVGFGDGLALLDPLTLTVTASIPLDGHAEGLAFSPDGMTVFVNVPAAREVAVVDVAAAAVAAVWPLGPGGQNFPMTLDQDRVLAGLRSPSGLAVLDAATGSTGAALPLCDDSDDLFADPARGLVYAVCGQGLVQAFRRDGEAYVAAGETATGAGARTGLFVPELDRLFVAVPARGANEAGILVLAPDPGAPGAAPGAAQLAPPLAYVLAAGERAGIRR